MIYIDQDCIPLPLDSGAQLPINLEDPSLDTPAVLVDLDKVEANLEGMATYARENGLFLRPHVKSHKSLYMASRQMDHGATGLCVATSSEAQVMFRLGVDIMLAYPLVGLAKLQRVLPMLRGKRLSLVVDEKRTLDSYIDFAQLNNLVIPVYVEVDTGMNRSGALPGESIKLVKAILKNPHLEFRGIMTHAGHAHSPNSEAGLAEVARAEAKVMGDLRFEIEKLGVSNFAVSAGSTLTSRYLKSSDGITEIRPGTYIYNDLRTMERWACSRDQIAVKMLTTISSARDRRITLDAGSKSITTSQIPTYQFGQFYDDQEVIITRLSEEHGVVDLPEKHKVYSIGDRVRILPIHVCVWMDLQVEIYGIRRDQIVERISNQAMRHSL
jgi:D-serine deaminase-like pyridoxal phosphate-dependent protein